MTSLWSILIISLQFICILAVNTSSTVSVTLETVDLCGGCKNGGNCDVAIPKCICDDRHRGQHCQNLIDGAVFNDNARTYNCQTDGGCDNDGICRVDTGECLCVQPFRGDKCTLVDDWWNESINKDKNKRSMIVSAGFAIVVMFVICFLIIFVNVKRVKEAREDAMEIRNATQVDGPPRLRISRRHLGQRNHDIESIEHNSSDESISQPSRRLSSWYWPFTTPGGRRISHSREGRTGLHPVSTAPAIMQGSIPPKYADITSLGNPDNRRGSTVTIQGTDLLAIPPTYDDVAGNQESEYIRLNSLYRGSTTSSGIFMRSIPSESESQDLLLERSHSRSRHCSGAHTRTSPRIEEESDENDSVFEDEPQTNSQQMHSDTSDGVTPEEIIVRQHLIGLRRPRDVTGSLASRREDIDEFRRLPSVHASS